MRPLLGFFFALLGCCAIAACSGSVGGGSALPGGQLPPLSNPQTPAAVVTSTPNVVSAQVVVSGDGSAQTLSAPGDFQVSAAFPQSSASPVTLRVTVSVNGPGDIAPYGDIGAAKKKLFGRHHPQSPAVLYVAFESDKGVTLSALPSMTFTVPLAALDPFGTDPVVDLALYDPAAESKWMQRIAEKSAATPAPSPEPSGSGRTASATATPTPSPSPTPTPSPAPTPSGSPRPGATPTPSATPLLGIKTPGTPVPSVVFHFTPTQRAMRLLPKKNIVFVLYAEPAPVPSASGAAASAGRRGSAAPSPAASAASGGSSPSTAASPSGSPSAAASSPPSAASPQPSRT